MRLAVNDVPGECAVEAWEDAQNHQDTAYYYGAAKHPGAVTKTVYPDSDDVTVAYNDDGTVNTRTDQRDWTVTYTYDDARRVTQESVSGNGLVGTSAVTYAYDALGRPTSVTDNNDPSNGNDNSTVEWTYTREADGDLTVEETQEYGTYTDRTVTVTYDLAGRMKSLEYPSGLTLTYAYDDLVRVTAVNDGTDDRVADTYRGWLLEKREYASGAYLTHLDDQGENLSGYGFDTFGRIKNHRWKASGGTLLAGWAYDYDRIGNKKYQEDLQSATQSELYGYDAVYRVTGFKRGQLNEQKTDITSPSRTQTWTLDPLGNWDDTVLDSVTETRTHNSINELTARTVGEDPQISLSYDAAGNLTQDGDSNGDHKYAWDYRNRLIEVEEKQSGNWNTTAEYKYDAPNRRVLKTVTSKGSLNGTTRFLWGGDGDWQCLEERDGSGDLVARFTYAPGYIDAVAVQERDLNSDDDFGDANEVVYYHQNTLFTVYALSDGNESVIERYRYDAYGACTVLDADGSADADGLSDVANPYAFTGRRLDPESALMQYRNRHYHPGLGRFIGRDPLGYQDQFSFYVALGCAPVVNLDPLGTGLLPFPPPLLPYPYVPSVRPGLSRAYSVVHKVDVEANVLGSVGTVFEKVLAGKVAKLEAEYEQRIRDALTFDIQSGPDFEVGPEAVIIPVLNREIHIDPAPSTFVVPVRVEVTIPLIGPVGHTFQVEVTVDVDFTIYLKREVIILVVPKPPVPQGGSRR